MKTQKALLVLVSLALCLSLLVPVGSAGWGTQKLDAVYRDIKIFMFGEEIVPKDASGKVVEPFIIDGTTYLPVRAIGEIYGLDVSWDSETSTIHITEPDLSEEHPHIPPEPSKKVVVSNAEELVKAIAPDTSITLLAGRYDVSAAAGTENVYVFWKEDFYGNKEKTLVISELEGLTLQAAPGAAVEIVTPWRFAEVLEFRNCNGIKLAGIKAGHTVVGYYECDAGVLCFRDSYNISLEKCLLYGSGTIGIELNGCVSAQISDTTVTDCSRCAVEVTYSDDVTFNKCEFVDNRAYDDVINGYESSAEFFDCVVSGNKSIEYGRVVAFGNALFERCVFRDNAHVHEYVDGSGPVLSGQSLKLRDCEIEKGNFSDYWGEGVIDLGGNKLT